MQESFPKEKYVFSYKTLSLIVSVSFASPSYTHIEIRTARTTFAVPAVACYIRFIFCLCFDQVPQYSPPRSSFSQERVTYHSLILVFLPSFLIRLEYSLLNSVQ